MPLGAYRIAEVGIRVTDLETSTEFYQDMLGLTLHKSEPGVNFLELGALDSPLGAAGHPQLLALFCREMELDIPRSSFDHIAFEIAPESYQSELQRFTGLGMVIRERSWPDSLPWEGRSFFFRDPDGHVIELIAANS